MRNDFCKWRWLLFLEHFNVGSVSVQKQGLLTAKMLLRVVTTCVLSVEYCDEAEGKVAADLYHIGSLHGCWSSFTAISRK